MTGRVEGLSAVIGRLNREISKIDGAGLDGLWDAGLQIQAVSQSRTPVDEGNLKGSAFTRRERNGVVTGNTAAYAIYVHEDLEARHTNGQAKFLESALRDNESRILKIVQRRARVKS